MILYDKLRLINWHYFLNETVPISNITFLTGANGTGKSTIIDAMQIVLTGDPSGKNFNKAASEKTGRTLKGYLYGETGEDADGNVKALRKGSFTSYVVLQFKEDDGSHFTIGIYFDCSTLKGDDYQFFYINDEFPEHSFTIPAEGKNGFVAMSGKELIEYCKKTYKPEDFTFFSTHSAYREFIKVKFGVMSDKYFTLFKKAVGFTPIVNISQFITEFVCDIEHHVDISKTQSNIIAYKKLDIEAKKMQVKINKLQDISLAYEEYSRIKEEAYLSRYAVDRANYEIAKLQYEKALKELSDTKASNEEAIEQIASININIRELEQEKDQKRMQKLKLPGFSRTSILQNKKSELTDKVAALQTGYEVALAKIRGYVNSFAKLSNDVVNAFNDCNIDFLNDPLKSSLKEFENLSNALHSFALEVDDKIEEKTLNEEDLRRFQELISSFNRMAASVGTKLENEIYDKSLKRSATLANLNSLKRGQKPFPQRYVDLKQSLLDRLLELHDDAYVDSYCDLIDIKDKTWTRAIEAVLYNNKFNFFVNEEYYEEANEIFSDLCRMKDIFNVSLVDASKLIEKGPRADDGSLARVVDTDDEGARAYTDFLLGRIKRCHTFKEARESGNGLLPDCTGYHNFSTWYLNPKRSAENFIGTNVSSEDAYTHSEEFNKLDREFSMLNRVNNSLGMFKTSTVQVMTTNECDSYIQSIKAFAGVQDLLVRIDNYDEELNEGDAEDVTEIDNDIENIDKDIQDLKENYAVLTKATGSYDTIIVELEKVKIPELKIAYDESYKNLSLYDKEFVDNSGEPYYIVCTRQADINKIISMSAKKLSQDNSRMRESESNLRNKRERYVTEYHLNYRYDDVTTNKEFDDELNRLSGVELPKYINEIKNAHEKAINEARDDFLYKLRTCITEVNAQIDKLNEALESIKFGRDKYRFSVTPNRDYRAYYDMIMDDLVLKAQDPNDLFAQKYSTLIGELIDLITSVSNENNSAEQRAEVAQKIEKFTDYRTYLVFDLHVKSDDSEFTSSLAKTFRRKSGGETQTPFYISILASFAQLYRTNQDRNNNTIRLVIFDEAFSKMDAVRIKESVSLLRNFGLQVILSTPSEKVANLATEVDSTLVVHHDGKRKRSFIARHESVEKTYQH